MDRLIHHVLETSASCFSDKEALADKDHRVTFAMAAKQIAGLAEGLRQIGVQRGDRVGIYLETSVPKTISSCGARTNYWDGRRANEYWRTNPQMVMKALRWVRSIFRTMLTLGVILAAAGVPTYAADVPGYPDDVTAYDAREVAMLPRYCAYTQSFNGHVPGGNNPGEIQRWYSILGPTFNDMHHYCWGLMKTNRGVLLARDEQVRRGYLEDSIREFDYVIRHAPPGFVLLPEIFMKKGENLIRLGQHGNGILQLLRAIELKPDYWPPYAVLSDYYQKTGDLKNAREVLQKGLSASPDATALKERLANLDAVKK